MFKEYLLILLFAHIVGDFYLQTECMARKKGNKYIWILVHCFYYWAVLSVIFLGLLSRQTLIYAFWVAGAHLVIDSIKYLYMNHKKPTAPESIRNIFFVDQAVHLASLMIVAYILAVRGSTLGIYGYGNVASFFEALNISPQLALRWALVILIVHKPANIVISKLLTIYKPGVETGNNTRDKNAGRFIGSLERIVMVILISADQYAAIGLVLTAKSIARYERITKDPEFSEYYLLGTLLSTLIAIVASLIL